MLNVCLDVSAAVQQSAGISRYERQLVKNLRELEGDIAFSFFYTVPKGWPTSEFEVQLADQPHRVRRVANKVWRLELLARQVARIPIDRQVFPATSGIFHGMDGIAPYLKAASVITVYDLSFLKYPATHSFYNRQYLRVALPVIARRAKRIIAISENTRRDLIAWLGPAIEPKIRVTPLGVSDESYFEPMPSDQLQEQLTTYNLKPQSYILCVGTIEPRKNQAGLVQAYTNLLRNWPQTDAPMLVLVGKIGWSGEYARVKAATLEAGFNLQTGPALLGADRQVVVLTDVNDTTLKALYQGARVCCYPSLYEGFGLPALEALAAGAPLITSDNSSLPEITGANRTNALLVEPTDEVQLTQALRTLLDDPILAEHMGKAGRERAKQFSWQRTARLTYEVYQELQTQ